MKKAIFMLIELLIVIAIIPAFAAMLRPTGFIFTPVGHYCVFFRQIARGFDEHLRRLRQLLIPTGPI